MKKAKVPPFKKPRGEFERHKRKPEKMFRSAAMPRVAVSMWDTFNGYEYARMELKACVGFVRGGPQVRYVPGKMYEKKTWHLQEAWEIYKCLGEALRYAIPYEYQRGFPIPGDIDIDDWMHKGPEIIDAREDYSREPVRIVREPKFTPVE